MDGSRLWPLLVSVLGHGLALGALAYFAVESGLGKGADAERSVAVGSAIAPVELVEAKLPPMPEIEFEAPPIVPEIRPERMDEAPLETLPPLRRRTKTRSFRVDAVPLDVARRRLRPEPAPPEPSPVRRAGPATSAAPARPRGESPPRLDPTHTPRYWPREAWDRGLRGTVLVLITVSTSGAVIEARVLRSSGHDLLDRAALASARQWRFRAVARPVRATLPFRFRTP